VKGDPCEDPLTGLSTRSAFDDALDARLDRASASGGRLVVMLLSVDGFEQLRQGGDPTRTDDALVRLRDALTEAIDALGGVAARYSEDTLGAIIDGIDRARAESISSSIRAALGAAEPVRVSVGIVAVEEGQAPLYKGGNALEAAAMRALDAARTVGGDCERTFVARRAA